MNNIKNWAATAKMRAASLQKRLDDISHKPFVLPAIAGIIVLGGLYSLYRFHTTYLIRTIIIESFIERPVFGLSALSNKNMLFVNSSLLEHTLITKNPDISSLSIRKVLPNTLHMSITFIHPTAILKTLSGDLLLNKEGVIMKKDGSTGYEAPEITYYQPLTISEFPVGSPIGYRDVRQTLTIIQTLTDLGIKLKSIDIASYTMIVCKDGISTYIFSAEKDLDTQIQEARRIITKSKVSGDVIQSLDVRFQKPIIVY